MPVAGTIGGASRFSTRPLMNSVLILYVSFRTWGLPLSTISALRLESRWGLITAK
jgi:hypothetical protein